MSGRLGSWLLMPFHAAAIATRAKSFQGNAVLGSAALNEAGLHVWRTRVAHRMAAWRRRRLLSQIDAKDAADFERDGFILKENFLPAARFEALRAAALALEAPAREMIQGDTVTRRIALDASALEKTPELRALVESREWLDPIRYVGSSALTPLTYIQTIFSGAVAAPPDPQTILHMDTFHPTVKAWLFLTDVEADGGPLTYVPGSHRLTERRLAWERRMSVAANRAPDRYTREGSFRIAESELAELGLPKPRVFAVPGNTLVVADTVGFHARGLSARPSVRVEIWAYGRRNPFLPWTGLDPVALPFVKGRAVPLIWAARDFGERLGAGRNPWRPVGTLTADAPPASLRVG
jgi:hypothetical protein